MVEENLGSEESPKEKNNNNNNSNLEVKIELRHDVDTKTCPCQTLLSPRGHVIRAMLEGTRKASGRSSSVSLFLSITINNLVHRSPSIGCWPAATPSECACLQLPSPLLFAILGFAIFCTPLADQPADDPFMSAANVDYSNRWPWPFIIKISKNS
jgi:hypothetical protein